LKHDPRASLTPGRISTVFFFPEASYEILKDKEKDWGKKTNYGKTGDIRTLI
jgi:hypothetical protein